MAVAVVSLRLACTSAVSRTLRAALLCRPKTALAAKARSQINPSRRSASQARYRLPAVAKGWHELGLTWGRVVRARVAPPKDVEPVAVRARRCVVDAEQHGRRGNPLVPLRHELGARQWVPIRLRAGVVETCEWQRRPVIRHAGWHGCVRKPWHTTRVITRVPCRAQAAQHETRSSHVRPGGTMYLPPRPGRRKRKWTCRWLRRSSSRVLGNPRASACIQQERVAKVQGITTPIWAQTRVFSHLPRPPEQRRKKP